MSNSDADNFALQDMKHELCDDRPCLECRHKFLRRLKQSYYAREITLEEADDRAWYILDELNAKAQIIAKKYNKRFKPYRAKDIW